MSSWLTRHFSKEEMQMVNKAHKIEILFLASVQFSRSVVSDSLWRHELQHDRPPCPSPSPGVHSNSRPSSWWCHPAILSSFISFSSCPQSHPPSSQAMVFPVVMYDVRVGLWRRLSSEELMLLNCGIGEDSWDSWTARRSNQSILKEISPECSLEDWC